MPTPNTEVKLSIQKVSWIFVISFSFFLDILITGHKKSPISPTGRFLRSQRAMTLKCKAFIMDNYTVYFSPKTVSFQCRENYTQKEKRYPKQVKPLINLPRSITTDRNKILGKSFWKL